MQNKSTTGRERREVKQIDSTSLLKKVFEYPEAPTAIETLERAGMPREVILGFLVLIHSSYENDLAHDLPRRKDLDNLATRVERLGAEITELSSSRLIPPPPRAYERPFACLPGILNAYSGYLRVQAYLFGAFRKTKPSDWKLHVIRFLECTKQLARRQHYSQIACLLSAVAWLHDSTEVIEPSTLKMMLKDHRKALSKPTSVNSMPKVIQTAIDRVFAEVARENGRKPLTLGQAIAIKLSTSSQRR